MKPILLNPQRARADRKNYAIKRMTDAARRILQASTIAEEIQAAHWTLAWAVIAGVRPQAGHTIH